MNMLIIYYGNLGAERFWRPPAKETDDLYLCFSRMIIIGGIYHEIHHFHIIFIWKVNFISIFAFLKGKRKTGKLRC